MLIPRIIKRLMPISKKIRFSTSINMSQGKTIVLPTKAGEEIVWLWKTCRPNHG